MKLRDLPRALGLASSPREYRWTIETFTLRSEGEVRFAQWQHPSETRKTITQDRVDALRSFLREGDVAIDVGAHTGDSALPIGLAVGPGGRVFALEPNPYVFKVLAVNATLNPRRARIEPLMFAAMPADRQDQFEYSDAGYCNGGFHEGIPRWTHGHFHRLRVEGRNLARYLAAHAPEALPRVRYVKIDTEGFDRAVVASLAEVIAAGRPYIRTEIYKHLPGSERDAYDADLRRLGYRLFKWGELEYRGEELAPGDLRRWTHFDVFAIPRERLSG